MLDSPLLSADERTLLHVRKLFGQEDYRQAAQVLKDMKGIQSEFLAAERLFLTATCHSRLGEWEEAYLHNREALVCYQQVNDRRGAFLTFYNASVDAQNLGIKKISKNLLERAMERAETIEEKVLIQRAIACNLSVDRHYAEAKAVLEKTLELCEELGTDNQNQLDVLFLKVVCSEIFFRAGDTTGAIAMLESIRNVKNFKGRARIFFNLGALRFIHGGELGAAPKLVLENKEFALKWAILAALEAGDLTLAKRLWNEIVELFPKVYVAGFAGISQYEEEGLFLQAIKMLKGESDSIPEVQLPIGSRMQALHTLLLESPQPLRKEEIIEKLWNKAYDPSMDQRFYKVIQRLKNMKLPVINERRAYFYPRANVPS